MAKGFFVTGTDTGVGKTLITAALIESIRGLGFSAGGMKPVESGCLQEGDVLVPSDGMFIKSYARMAESIRIITPVCLKSPLAPLPASEIDGIRVDLSAIRKAFETLSAKYDAVVVEGIGGLLVPISKGYFVSDMATDFGLPLVVVSRPTLGTINHTMLTVKCAMMEGLQVAGVVINYNQPPENTVAESTNPGIIEQISPVPVLGIFPYLPDMESSTIEKAAQENLDADMLRRYLTG